MRKGLATFLCFLFLVHVGIPVLPVYACKSEVTTHALHPCCPEPEIPPTPIPTLQTVSKENRCCTLSQAATHDIRVAPPAGSSPPGPLKMVLVAHQVPLNGSQSLQSVSRPGPLSHGRAPPGRLPFAQKTVLRI